MQSYELSLARCLGLPRLERYDIAGVLGVGYRSALLMTKSNIE